MPKIDVDLRYVGIAYEFWGLREFLSEIEPALDHLRTKDESAVRARLEEQGLPFEDDDVQFAFQEVLERAERIFPRLLRGPFLMALWGVYQGAVEEVAEQLRRERKIAIKLRDLKGSFFHQADKYYSSVLCLELDPKRERQARIRDMYELRNWLAHANGREYPLTDDKAKSLPALAERCGNTVDSGYFIPSPSYLEQCYKDVTGSMSGLVARARGKSEPQDAAT